MSTTPAGAGDRLAPQAWRQKTRPFRPEREKMKTFQTNEHGRLTIETRPKHEILRLVNQALEAQFDIYSWAHMINDIDVLTSEEKAWAQEHTGYKAYIC